MAAIMRQKDILPYLINFRHEEENVFKELVKILTIVITSDRY